MSCSADRQIIAKINKDGIFIEELEHNPGQYLPLQITQMDDAAVDVDLTLPMKQILE